jgi:phage shock protein A
MKNNKTSELIEALKEYNKTLADQIKRMKSFIEDIDKQLNYHKRLESAADDKKKKINHCFSRQYLIERADKYRN